jgi:hypothetical protein
MLYFRFVANAFVLSVGEVKLWEAGFIVKRKQEVSQRESNIRSASLAQLQVKMHQNANLGGSFMARSCSIRGKKAKSDWPFRFVASCFSRGGMAAW